MRIRLAFLLLLPGLLAAQPAAAQALSVCVNVSVTATPLAFNYFPASTAQNSAAIKLSCGVGLFVLPAVTVALAAGNSGTYANRRMDDGTGNNHLTYNIYTASGGSTVWGDGTGGSQTQSVNGSLLGLGTYSFTAYGVVPSGQYVTATSYADQMMVQITF
jgi:spore coat protein U-like protein